MRVRWDRPVTVTAVPFGSTGNRHLCIPVDPRKKSPVTVSAWDWYTTNMHNVFLKYSHINKIVCLTILIHADKYSSQGPGPGIK
jgi:hypothetical protein